MNKHYCCVPGCKSKREKKASGKNTLTFHEFPAISPARELWIEAIRNQFPDEEKQKTWHPHETTKVCCLHFSPDQYRETKKRVCLKSGSIPHIFLDQNSSKIENLENESDLLPLKFSKNINEKWVEEPKLKYDKVPTVVICNINTHSSPNIVTLPALSTLSQNANNHNSSNVSDLVVDSSSCSSGMLENSGTNLNSGISENPNIFTHFDQNFTKDQPDSTDLSCKQDVCEFSSSPALKEVVTKSCGTQTINLEDKVDIAVHSDRLKRKHEREVITKSYGTQTMNLEDKVNSRSVKTALKRKRENEDDDHLRKHRHIVNKLKARILNLEQKNENLKLLNQRMNESLNLFNIKELENGIANLNARALFLFEQLNSFAKKETFWSDSTVKIINNLEKKFPQSYEYLKGTDIISLPPPKDKRQFEDFEKKL